ncbi:putative RNA recognition motif domain, nucleotide-binding alpha-beta plait domain superfamily [Helianthus annuus]|nr:putative RNA recognition motif domain, nucleotide-binding alpha-beta plait domain superfamily [Helianthus annuus]KAJ0619188.1 putative RNA recognition motif domain, nucleotide-binding alpha-beta plait domain superfamily [Helianthus annuus]KAJ0777639.1 putative RNA recognition motif domain, nucleotide-binding alpha-beta plait domain superfamily [Helianthus annuus]KAJ0786665.1 putative RNA recognition motif domain, nucleotide-binding alpha-beta plait domain superfamily [Helianthus annuus]
MYCQRHRKPIPETIQRRITKIFVTNLPEKCSGSDLSEKVRMFGQIFDLYIARKRDRGGNRFGFVSLLDVKDKEELLKKNLRSIRMGDGKLWFNIARFVLEDGEINTGRDIPAPTKTGNSNVKHGVEPSGSRIETGDRSFKDMLVGKSITIDNHVSAFSTMHGRAIVVRMCNLEALKNIYVILNDICPGLGKVQYLGGLNMLISFEDSETAASVLEAAKLVNDRFSMISLWEGQSLGFERLAWLKVQGIPLHLLTSDVINVVGGMFGKVVHKANRSEEDADLSFEYVGVLVGDGKKVSEEIILNWNNRKFRVWIMEELGDWVPDFYEVKHVE